MPKLTELTLSVRKAQAGDQEAQLELLRKYGWREGKFKNFLGKYVNLLWYGKLDFKNKESRKFIRLYIKDPLLKKKLSHHFIDYTSKEKIQLTMNFIQNKVNYFYTKEELKQDLTYIFLERIQSYKRVYHVDFSGYIMGTFRFKVYQTLQKKIFKYDYLNIEDREYDFEVKYHDNDLIALNGSIFSEKEDLDIFWINGETGEYFKDFDNLDRIILRDWYLLRKTDSEIARNNGFHRNSILNKRHLITKVLEEKIKRGEE